MGTIYFIQSRTYPGRKTPSMRKVHCCKSFPFFFRLIPRSTEKIINKIYFLSSIGLNFETFYRQWSTSYLNMVNILKEITQNRTTHNILSINQSIKYSISQSINQSICVLLLTARQVRFWPACLPPRPSISTWTSQIMSKNSSTLATFLQSLSVSLQLGSV